MAHLAALMPTLHCSQIVSFRKSRKYLLHYLPGDIPPTGQAFFWMQYFPCQVSDGFAVYNDTKKHYESQNVIFQRLFPRSEESGLYPMDEMDVDAMINTVENEKRDDPKYFQEILVAGYF